MNLIERVEFELGYYDVTVEYVSLNGYIYIYIYIYVCVCVCVCVWIIYIYMYILYDYIAIHEDSPYLKFPQKN